MFDTTKIQNAVKLKKRLNYVFLILMCLIEVLILTGIIYIVIQLVKGPGEELYSLMALQILLIWFGVLVAYFAWSVYFFNINLGRTNEDWAEIRAKEEFRLNQITETGSSNMPVDCPTENPNSKETMGLPTGTVRGTLAISLLIGGMAMAVAALGMDSQLKDESFLVDNFEFFKTAFLMMIAFYFGSKTLKQFGSNTKTDEGDEVDGTIDQNKAQPLPSITGSDSESANAAKAMMESRDEDLSKDMSAEYNEYTEEDDGSSSDFDIPGSVQ
jgi:hypothetical protein